MEQQFSVEGRDGRREMIGGYVTGSGDVRYTSGRTGSTAGAVQVCAWCGAEYIVSRHLYESGKSRFCSYACNGKNQGIINRHTLPHPSGEKNNRWRGGRDAARLRNIENMKLRAQMFPEKSRAVKRVYKAIKRGVLEKMPCEICGEEKAVAHHEDYSKPLDVVWVCRSHHIAVHKCGLSAVREQARCLNAAQGGDDDR